MYQWLICQALAGRECAFRNVSEQKPQLSSGTPASVTVLHTGGKRKREEKTLMERKEKRQGRGKDKALILCCGSVCWDLGAQDLAYVPEETKPQQQFFSRVGKNPFTDREVNQFKQPVVKTSKLVN